MQQAIAGFVAIILFDQQYDLGINKKKIIALF